MKGKSEKTSMGITFFIVGLALLVVFSGVVSAESDPPPTVITPTGDDIFINGDTYIIPGLYNIIDENHNGVLIINCDDCTLDCQGATFIGDGSRYSSGIYNDGHKGVTIKNCNLESYENGIIYSSGADDGYIKGNSIKINNDYGAGIAILLSDSNNVVSNEICCGNSGIGLKHSSNNLIEHNTCKNNGAAGIPISDESSNNKIRFNEVRSTYGGWGVIIYKFSDYNLIEENDIISNWAGVAIADNSVGNIIKTNTITDNDYGFTRGVRSDYSSMYSYDNDIYDNYFDNDINAIDEGENYWNIGEQSGTNIIGGPYLGGNYWSDYTGIDPDGNGLGDTELPYTCNGNIQSGGDYLPLVTSADAVPQIVSVEILNVNDIPTNIFTPGDTVKVKATISNPSQYRDYSVSVSMNIDEDTDGSNGVEYDSNEEGEDWDTDIDMGVQDSSTWSWVVPSQTEAEKTYHVAVGIHDQLNYYDICYDCPGYMWDFDAALPDLTISRDEIWFDYDGLLKVGLEGMVVAQIHNEGNAAATDITVRFFDADTQLEKDVTISLIGAGDAETVYTDWTLGERNYINVIVDPHDKIPELREDNNRDFISIVLTGFYPPEDGFAFENPGIAEVGDYKFGAHCLGMSITSRSYFLDDRKSMPPPGDPCNDPEGMPHVTCETGRLIRWNTLIHQLEAMDEDTNSRIDYDRTPCQADVEYSMLLPSIRNTIPEVLTFHKHAVLAYGIVEIRKNEKAILIYDPNKPNDENRIYLDWSDDENCFVMRPYDESYDRFAVFEAIMMVSQVPQVASVAVFSPVNLVLEDPDGLVISRELNEIIDAAYVDSEDLNEDGDLDDLIVISDLKLGDYQITVIPESDVEDTDTYTLEVTAGDTTIVLAEDVQISDIPDLPYHIESTGTTINAAPVADSNGPYAGNEPITFDASGSYDPDGSIDLYEWDFDGDGVYDAATSTAIFTWGDDHTGTVELRVTDNDGLSDTDTASITVNNVAPTAFFYVEQPEDFILPYHSLTFNGASTDAGWLDVHAATWDFGDGTIISGTLTPIGTTTVEHAYVEPGEYTVTLTVTDDDGGTGADTTTVTVISAEEAAGMIIDQLGSSIVPAEVPEGVSQKIESAIDKLDQVINFLDQGMYCDAIGKLDGMITQIEGAIDQVNEQRCSIKDCKEKKCICIANEDADKLIESLEQAKEGAIAIRDFISAEHPECAHMV